MPAFLEHSPIERGGFLGMDKTQFLLPTDAAGAGGKKIAGLPFLLGTCWMSCSSVLRNGINSSNHPELLDEPGRVFDILFFMQGNSTEPISVICDPPCREWYIFKE